MRRYFEGSKRHVLVQVIAFQFAWFLCLYSQGIVTLLVATAYLFFAVQQFPHKTRGLLFVAFASSIGSLIDSVYSFTGWLQFPSVTLGISFNLIAVWFCFSSTLLTMFSWLQNRWWMAGFLGAVFGPLSYYAGMQLGSVVFPRGVIPTLATYSVTWFLLFPMLIWLSQRQFFNPEITNDAPTKE